MSTKNPEVLTKQAFDPEVVTLASAETEIISEVPAGWHKQIESVTVANITGVAAAFSLYLKPQGVAAAAANAICVGVAIAANTIYQLPIGPLYLPDGWELTGLTSAGDDVNVTVTGHVVPIVESQLLA